jgi:hypothetical protein
MRRSPERSADVVLEDHAELDDAEQDHGEQRQHERELDDRLAALVSNRV